VPVSYEAQNCQGTPHVGPPEVGYLVRGGADGLRWFVGESGPIKIITQGSELRPSDGCINYGATGGQNTVVTATEVTALVGAMFPVATPTRVVLKTD
jgi:hypothetical protein